MISIRKFFGSMFAHQPTPGAAPVLPEAVGVPETEFPISVTHPPKKRARKASVRKATAKKKTPAHKTSRKKTPAKKR